MNKFHKLLVTTTTIASGLGQDLYLSANQAQSHPGMIIASQFTNNTDNFKKDSNNNLTAQSQNDVVQFAVNAIHRLRTQGKINISKNGKYTFDNGNIKVDIENVGSIVQSPYNPFSNWITITNIKDDIAIIVKVTGSNSYKGVGMYFPRRGKGKTVDLCCKDYYPR